MKFLFSVLCMLISLALFSQSNLEEVVYLKNGSVIRGTIIEQVPNQSLKIQTKDGNIFVYNMSEVEKITKEEPYIKTQTNGVTDNSAGNSQKPPKQDIEIKAKINNLDYLKKGFMGITEIGGVFERSPFSLFSINQFLGKRTSQTLSIGVGIGVEARRGILLLPVTIDTRIYFLKKRISPFLNIAPGYELLRFKTIGNYGDEVDFFHAFITNFGLGAEFKISKQVGISLNVGGRLTYIPRQEMNLAGGNGFLKFGVIY